MSIVSPNAVLIDADGNLIGVDGNPLKVEGDVDATLDTTGLATSALQDAGNASLVSIDSKLGAALPLPTGAATSAQQTTGNTSLAAINNKLGGTLTVDGSVSVGNFPVTQTVSGSVSVSNLPTTQAVSATTLPLPTGAATEATLASLNSKTPALVSGKVPVAIDGTLSIDATGIATADKQDAAQSELEAIHAKLGGTVAVDGSAHTQPVSGSVSVSNFPTTQPVSGSVTVDGSVAITNLPATQPVSGSVAVSNFPTTQAVSGTITVGNFPTTQPVSGSVTVSNLPATQAVSAAALPLPTGASTSANQATANNSLSSIDGKLPALSSGRVPVDIGSSSISGTVAVSNFPATQPVSAATLPLPSGAATSAKQPALGTAGTPSTDVITVQGAATMTALKVDGSAVTQPVSGTITVSNLPATQPVSAATLPLPAGASTSALQTTGNSSLSSIDGKLPALSSGRVPVDIGSSSISGTVAVSNFPATQAVSAATLPLPSGAATSAKQDTGNTSLGNIDTKTPALVGGKVPVDVGTPAVTVSNFPASQPVSGSVSVSNFPATQPVSAASLPLPAGAAQDSTLTGGTAKAIIRGGAKGTTTAADVTSVATGANHQALAVAIVDAAGSQITSFGGSGSGNQGTPNTTANAWPMKVTDGTNTTSVTASSALKVDGSAVTQPVSGTVTVTGVATETTLGTRLADATFTGRINTQGQKTSAASTPVVLASDQSSIPVAATISGTVAVSSTTLALDATLTGGTQKAIARGAAKGATTAADVTSTAEGTDHQAIDVQLYHGGTAKDPTQIRALTSSDTVTISGTPNVAVTSTVLATGASTETTLGTRLADATFTGRINTQGQKAMAASTPVVIASDQSALPISGTVTATISGVAQDSTLTGGTQKAIARGGAKGSTTAADITSTAEGTDHQAIDVQLYHGGTAINPTQIRALASGTDTVTIVPSGTQTVSGTVTVTGVSTETTLGTRLADATFTGRINTQGQKTSAASTPVVLASDQSSIPVAATISGTPNVAVTSTVLPTGASTETTLSTRLADSTFTGRINTQGQKTMAASTPVVLASDQSAMSVAVTNVPLTATGTISSSANTAALTLNGRKSVGVSFSASAFVSGVVPQATIDGSAWVSCYWFDLNPFNTNTFGVPVYNEAFNIASSTIVSRGVLLPPGAQAVRLSTGGVFTSGSMNYTITASDHSVPDFDFAGGFQKATVRGGAKGSTGGADVTSSSLSANRQALDVLVYDATGNAITSFASESTLSTLNTKFSTLGQKLSANSTPVVLSSDQSSIPVTATISGTPTVTANLGTLNGAALDATLTGGTQLTRLTDGSSSAAIKASGTAASGSDTALVTETRPATTSALGSLAATTSSATLFNATSRRGATIVNESTSVMYIALSATCSATAYTIALAGAASAPYAYYETPFGYSGTISAIWVSATGNARLTQILV